MLRLSVISSHLTNSNGSMYSRNESLNVLQSLLQQDFSQHHFEFFLAQDEEHKHGLVSHSTLGLCAGFLCGAKEQQLKSFAEQYTREIAELFSAPLVPPLNYKPPTTFQWKEYLGQPEKMNQLVPLLREMVKTNGLKSTLEQLLPSLSDGILCSLLHGWVLCSYGLEQLLYMENIGGKKDWNNSVIQEQSIQGLCVLITRSQNFGSLPAVDVNSNQKLSDVNLTKVLESSEWKAIWESMWSRNDEIEAAFGGIPGPTDYFRELAPREDFRKLFEEQLDIKCPSKLGIANIMEMMCHFYFKLFEETSDFAYLHGITCLRATDVFVSVLDKDIADYLIRGTWRGLCVLYLIGESLQKEVPLPPEFRSRGRETELPEEFVNNPPSWDRILSASVDVNLAHSIKITWAAYALAQQYPNVDSAARKVAAIATARQMF